MKKSHKNWFKIITIVVSTLLLFYVIYPMNIRGHESGMRLRDRVVLSDGSVKVGQIVRQTAEEVVIRPVKGEPESIPVEGIRKEKGKPAIQRGVWTVLRQMKPGWFAAAVVLFALPPVSGAVRWRMLLKTQGVTLSNYEACSLTFIGYYFNYVMLGLTGGDVVKAYYVSRQTHKKTVAVLSVFMDRVIGLIALSLLAVVIVLTKLGDPGFGNVVVPVAIFGVMACFCVLVLLSRRLRRNLPQTMVVVAAAGGALILLRQVLVKGMEATWTPIMVFAGIMVVLGVVALTPLVKLLKWDRLKEMLAGNRIVREMDESFHEYRGHPWVMVIAFVMSSAIHLVNIVGTYALGQALGVGQGVMTYLLLLPVILMISSVPISVAGLGVQEKMFQVFFGLPAFGVTANVASMLAFMFRLCGSFLWIIPGYFFLWLWRDRPSAQRVEELLAAESN